MPVIRFAVRRLDGSFWAGRNHWSETAASARWFSTWEEAELAGLRDLPDPVNTWDVVVIPESAYTAPVRSA